MEQDNKEVRRITESEIISKAKELGLLLGRERIEYFLSINRLPELIDIEKINYVYKGHVLKLREKNFKNRRHFWKETFQIIANYPTLMRDLKDDNSALMVYMADGNNMERIALNLIDGNIIKDETTGRNIDIFNYEPDTDEEFLSLVSLFGCVMLDFFTLNKKFSKE